MKKIIISIVFFLVTSYALAFQGLVKDVKQTNTYTYLEVEGEKQTIWMAVTKRKVDKGEIIDVDLGKPFKNFQSKALNRTFKELHLVSQYKINGSTVGASSPKVKKKVLKANIKLGSIKKADYLISEIFQNKDKLAGKTITIRGKVVKFAPKIMGKNWIHLQDGSGKAGTNDLTITSQETVKFGDIVLFKGKVVTNQDIGAGYKYDVLLEEAKVIK
jgi:hypothetical protein